MHRKILQLPMGCWLGCQDSNLGMAESKSAALPLGYTPAVFGGDGVIRVFRMGFKGEHELSASRA
jgi:hypothetical protein